MDQKVMTVDISNIVKNQKEFVASGTLLNVDYRKRLLTNLKSSIEEHLDEIHNALKADLNKPLFEAFTAETMFVINEIDHTLKKLNSWVKPKKVSTPAVHQPAKCWIRPEPYGTVLIIGPWNYPFQLVISPLIGALSAGNSVILKPSELSPNVTEVIKKVVAKAFKPEEVAVVDGGPDETNALIDAKMDYILYTGSTQVGRLVYERAAKYLTPVTLELGGKSPCLIHNVNDVDMVAKRIVWGKYMNAGQTCIAPDYILIDPSLKEEFIKRFGFHVTQFYGENPKESEDYARIINERHFNRLKGYLDKARILFGGDCDESQKYISPTLVEPEVDSPLMQEEIFGPILPIIESENIERSISFIKERAKPLALYVFSDVKDIQEKVLDKTSSGSVCINDTIIQITPDQLPFGGVGDSGIGHYHGKFSFDTFSHQKSVMKRTLKFDVPLRYPPFPKKLNLIKFLLKNFG